MINPIDNAFMIDELCKLFPEFDINTISHTIYRVSKSFKTNYI